MADSPEQAIFEIVDRYWDNRSRPLLLANLGGLMPPEVKAKAVASSGSLSKFIAQNLGDKLRLLRLIEHGGGVVPIEKTVGMSDEELEAMVPVPRRVGDLAPVLTAPPKFYADVWRAFSTPIAGIKRYIKFVDGNKVEILESKNEVTLNGCVEVFAEDLPSISVGSVLQTKDIASAIRRWATAHSIDIRRLRPPSRRPETLLPDSQSNTESRLSSGTLDQLERFLVSLSPSELGDFSVSGVLLLSLLRRR